MNTITRNIMIGATTLVGASAMVFVPSVVGAQSDPPEEPTIERPLVEPPGPVHSGITPPVVQPSGPGSGDGTAPKDDPNWTSPVNAGDFVAPKAEDFVAPAETGALDLPKDTMEGSNGANIERRVVEKPLVNLERPSRPTIVPGINK